MNPRLSIEWLRYLVTVGGREEPDGWRWKLDASMRFGGFGPWRPEWVQMRLPGLGVPFLGVLVSEYEEMGWGTRPEDLVGWMPPLGRVELVEGSGHFVHIEQPDLVISMVMDLLERA
jgi:pimeloyl-ACP methyl ester carboxylesterase